MTTETTEQPASDGSGTTISVVRVVPRPVEQVWSLLTTPAGAEALLGPGAVLGGKGEPWHSSDGTHGVMRSYHPMEQVRLSWHADDEAPASLVELQLRPEGDGTRLDLRHERITDPGDGAGLQQRWESALDRIEVAAT